MTLHVNSIRYDWKWTVNYEDWRNFPMVIPRLLLIISRWTSMRVHDIAVSTNDVASLHSMKYAYQYWKVVIQRSIDSIIDSPNHERLLFHSSTASHTHTHIHTHTHPHTKILTNQIDEPTSFKQFNITPRTARWVLQWDIPLMPNLSATIANHFEIYK